ncbi:C4-dicarboxylate ABC transporter [Streptococcus sobrinus]|uniref:C4-dicarboxylate ABC transporter n=1 Tax=Streptococcus sobrinus TaxID=1310 RepID=UPI000309D8C6|nr:C4-dicarboxylate ABC transporter [Streptococcus sobrinus]
MKRRLPLALTGLLLGLTALTNLITKFVNRPVGYSLLLLCLGLWLVLTGYFLLNKKDCQKQLTSLLAASTFPTYFMAMMLSPLVLPLAKPYLLSIWALGLLGHLTFLILFSIRAKKQASWEQVYPGWFVIYVGPAAASITARLVRQVLLGQVIFYLTFLAYLILMLALFYRLAKWPLREQELPNIAIMAAPSSLLLLAFLQLYPSGHPAFLLLLLLLSQGFYWGSFLYLARHLKTWFVPGFSAFTFPSVSTATALKLSLMRLQLTEGWLVSLSNFEIGLASLIVAYVALAYLYYLSKSKA